MNASLASIDIQLIDVGTRLRKVDDAQVKSLMDSIAEVGLLNPITVFERPVVRGNHTRKGFGIIAGAHRKAACERLGMTEMPAHILLLSELQRQIAECDENLRGPTLGKADLALFTRRRKEAYEALHPETRQGVAGAKAKHGSATDKLSFAEATAEATGRDVRTIQRDAERGAKVIDEVLELVRGTVLDTGTYLDRIKNMPPNDQVQAATRDLSMERRKAREIANVVPRSVPEPREMRDEPLSRMDRRKLEITIKDLRSTKKEFAAELQEARAENARLRDRCQTLEHELAALQNRFGVPA